MFVRAGLVRPPSLVSSAVDARLVLLIIERRRVKSVLTSIWDWVASISGFFWKAFVRRDSFRSLCSRTADL